MRVLLVPAHARARLSLHQENLDITFVGNRELQDDAPWAAVVTPRFENDGVRHRAPHLQLSFAGLLLLPPPAAAADLLLLPLPYSRCCYPLWPVPRDR